MLIFQPIYHRQPVFWLPSQSCAQHFSCKPYVAVLDHVQQNVLQDQDLIFSFSKPGDDRRPLSEAPHHPVNGSNDYDDRSHQENK